MLRMSLSLKILLLALVNLALLVLVFFVFARLQFSFELSSFFLSQARERVVSTSRLVALQLPDTGPASWNGVLTDFSSRYPADLYLFDSNGQELAGPRVTLPPEFLKALRNDPFAKRSEAGKSNRFPPGERRAAPPGGSGEPPPGPPPDDAYPRRGEPNDHRPGDMPHRKGSGGGEASLPLIRTSNPVRYWAGVRIPIWSGGREEPIHATLVWEIRSLWTELFFFDYRPWLAVVLAVLGVSVTCWLPLIRGLTVAISRLTAATGQIADGHFEITLRLQRRDELGRLSDSINRMAQRLSGFVYGQKRFLSDVAHELSSPIARMQVGLSILEQRADEPELAYVADVKEEVEHMSSLVDELLSFSKSQVTDKRTSLQSVPLSDVVAKVLAREGSDTVTIRISVESETKVLAQPDSLFRALANVVRNAVRYAGNAGPIEISASRQDDDVVVSVADSGPGLPESEVESVFRPFYRPEFARQRETGGAGLGLAIVRDCVETCGGTVQCRNRTPHGLDVRIRLRAAV